MASTSYYGLKASDGSIVAKGWTTLPTIRLYIGEKWSSYQQLHVFQWIGTEAGIRQASEPSAPMADPPYDRIAKGEGVSSYNDYVGNPGVQINAGLHTFLRITSKTMVDRTDPIFFPTLEKQVSLGQTVYDQGGTTVYTVVKYYVYSVSATTNAVNGTRVGNVAICDASTGTVIAGSKSSTAAIGSDIVTCTINSDQESVSVRFFATAVVGSTTESKTDWHTKYFFNGLYAKGFAIANANITYAESSASCTVSFGAADESKTFVANYGPKYALTINALPVGISSTSVSYTRTHSTGSYVSTSISPVARSSAGALYIESGRAVSFSGNCSSGYVFSTANGFISTTTGVSSITGNNSDSILSASGIPAMTKACAFDVTCSSYTISINLPSAYSSWGTVSLSDGNGNSGDSLQLVQGRTYAFSFASSRANQEFPTIKKWTVGGTEITGSSYVASDLTGNVVVSCTIQQNSHLVTLSAGSNGAVVAYKRYYKPDYGGSEIDRGETATNKCWLRDDGHDYLKCTVTPNSHYEISVVTKPSNVAVYSDGGANCFTLTSAGNSTIGFQFALSECVVKTSTSNVTLCTVSPASQTIRFDASDQYFVTVYCNIREEYIGAYRVDYFESSGGATFPAEVGGAGQYYYAVYAATVGGNAEMTFYPHLVSTSNKLTVNKTGDTVFSNAYVKVGTDTEESVSGVTWFAQVRENNTVICRAVALFGGQLGLPTTSGITNPQVDAGRVEFSMPSNAATVNFNVTEKDKITVSLQLANASNPDVMVGKIVMTAPQSATVNEMVTGDHTAHSFNIYKSTIYYLDADDSDMSYTFSGWYVDGTCVQASTHLEVNRSTGVAYVAKYTMRRTGTVVVSYGLKSGDTVTPTDLPSDSQPFGLVLDPEGMSPRTPPDVDPDQWIIGNSKYVNFKAVAGNSLEDGLPWVWTPSRVEVMVTGSDESWTAVWTYDSTNPSAITSRFVMRDDMTMRLVFSKQQAVGYGLVRAMLMDGCTGDMGESSVFATDMQGYYVLGGFAEAVCHIGRKAVLAASPRPGYAFGGWYKEVGETFELQESDGAVLTVDSITSVGATYYASFIPSESSVNAWNDGIEPKMLEWRSKVYVGTAFFAMRNVRVYSDVYPVYLKIMTATSPNGCFDGVTRSLDLVVTGQSPRLIPPMRLEKYFAFEIKGVGRINHIALSSSMEGLR